MAAVISFCRVSSAGVQGTGDMEQIWGEQKKSFLYQRLQQAFHLVVMPLYLGEKWLFCFTIPFYSFTLSFLLLPLWQHSLCGCVTLSSFHIGCEGRRKGVFHCYMIHKVNQRVFENQLLPVGCSITISASIWRCGIAWHRGGICSASPLAAATLSHLMQPLLVEPDLGPCFAFCRTAQGFTECSVTAVGLSLDELQTHAVAVSPDLSLALSRFDPDWTPGVDPGPRLPICHIRCCGWALV